MDPKNSGISTSATPANRAAVSSCCRVLYAYTAHTVYLSVQKLRCLRLLVAYKKMSGNPPNLVVDNKLLLSLGGEPEAGEEGGGDSHL